jgi:DSF synthase
VNAPVQGGGLQQILSRRHRYLSLEWMSDLGALRVRTRVTPIQCYSLAGLAEMQQLCSDIAQNPGVVRQLVLSSDVTGVFNFGGDLSLFVLLVRAQDIDSLRLYGRKCVELVWWLENAATLGVHTIALVQGDTLGGGLESVMPFHRIIFERSASAGLPETLFNLFPGMGAWNFIVRRAGFQVANEMILSGRLYTAEELFHRGLVDLVVEDGQGEKAVHDVLRQVEPRLRGTLAALRARSLAAPITLDSLIDIVDVWAETAMGLTMRDLKLMERLARAQVKKVGGAPEGAIDEIKRIELETAWQDLRGAALGPGEGHTGITEWGALP